jgi:hypothetical protein
MTNTLVGNAAQSPVPSSMKAWHVHEFESGMSTSASCARNTMAAWQTPSSRTTTSLPRRDCASGTEITRRRRFVASVVPAESVGTDNLSFSKIPSAGGIPSRGPSNLTSAWAIGSTAMVKAYPPGQRHRSAGDT